MLTEKKKNLISLHQNVVKMEYLYVPFEIKSEKKDMDGPPVFSPTPSFSGNSPSGKSS